MTKKLVHTEAFKKWFKGSKVVDEFGNPKIMYHGSENMDKITVFKSNKGHDYSFFTDDQYEASRYVPAITIKEGGFYIRKTNWAKIKPFYIKALKIFDPQKLSEVEFKKLRGFLRSHEDELIGRLSEFASDEGMSYDEYLAELDYPESASKQEVIEYALTRSTDNWCLLEMDIFQDYIKSNGYDSFISNESGALNIAVYDANNIKLADGSNTTFNPNNPDIRFAKGGKTPKKKVKKKKVYKNKALVKLIDQAKGQLTLFDEPEVAEEEIIINPEFLKARRESEPDPQFTVLSFGGGQDSFAILYSLVYDYDFKKKYAPNDFIVVMSDTGNEFPYTYQAVKEAEKFCNEHDIHFKFVTPDMGYHTDGWQSLKANMKRNKVIFGAAMARKSCTSSLKIDVVDKYAYDYMCNLYGFEEAKSKKSWYAYKYKFNTKARVLIGFAKDEESRAKKSIKGHKFLPKWKKTNIQYVYPLIEEGWNRQSAQNIIKLYRELIPPSNCMICFYQSDQELIWLEKNHPEEFNEWVIMEKAKLDRFEGKVDKNYGVYGAITLPEKLAKAKAKYGHMTDEELWEYKMSHGHCVKSAY